MATSSGGQSPTVVQVSQKPSIRKRLFSSTSKKSAKLAKDTSDAPVPDLPPASQNPANDSTTTTSEPLNSADQGQGPSPHVHGSASPDHKTHLTTPPPETRTDDMDRERSSVNTTLTANRRTPFYRRKANKSSTSEGALSSSGSHSVIKIATGLSRPKPSFLSRVVQKVVPCVGPIPDGPPQTRDDDVSRTPESRPSLALKDLSTVKHPDPVVNSQAVDDVNSPNDVQSGLTIPIINMLPSLSQAETEVLIPPPPTMQLQPEDETDGMTSGAVQPPGSTGNQILRTHVRDRDDPEASITDDEMDQTHIRNEQEEEERLIKNGGSGIPIGPDGIPKPLLPPIAPQHAGRKCLVLDLDETLVHSSFRAVQQADFIVPVEIEYHWHHFHVLKRPGVDNFLKKMGEIYELVVFTASLSKYADPVLDKLDIHHVVAHRLFRESCYSHKGNYVKDLSQLGRPIADTIILDNSPASYIFHPYNAVPVSSWFNDPHDAELTDLIPFLTDLTFVHDVRGVLDGAR